MKLKSWILAGTMLLPFGAHAQSYVVGLAHMTVWNGVCRGPNCTDTDYISLTVKGPNGQIWSKTYGPNDLHKNNRSNWDLQSPPISVPADSNAKLEVTWAAVNKGHDASAENVKAAIDKAADAYAKSNDTDSSNLAKAIVETIKAGVGWFTQNCDTSLFSGTEVYDGATLATTGPTGYTVGVPPDTSPKGSQEWWHVYDYLSIPSPCNTGRYNQVVWIAKQ